MLKIMNVPKHGYEGAYLDEDGNPQKVTCDILEVVSYFLDADTSPMMSLTVTYGRFDSTAEYYRAGPVTQHLITGEELADIIEKQPAGITIEEIDKSTAKTGIPSAGIEPKDVLYMPNTPGGPAWRAEYYVKKLREQVKKLQEQRMQPGPGPQPPILPFPQGEQA